MVHYICGYAKDTERNRWKYSPAGTAKMEYILLCLDELNIDYRAYSTCQTIEPKWCGKMECGKIRYRSSFSTKNKYSLVLDRAFAIIQLLVYLLRIPSEDTVLVYHERYYTSWVNFVHRLKKWRLIWEVEEIYKMVHGNIKEEVDKEIVGLSEQHSGCDGYILSTSLLKRYFPNNAIICNGAYHPVYSNNTSNVENPETIHIVYGGTLNKTKGGAIAAAAAKYLNSNYHVHILGFGDDEQIQQINELVKTTNAHSKATVSYDGCLRGEDYRNFIRKCQIGLSTQNPSSDYNNTSFPSKVLEYLRNGLNVVTIDIPAVRQSEVHHLLNYYETQTPEALAKSICKVNFIQSKEIVCALDKLHEKFKQDLESLLNS